MLKKKNRLSKIENKKGVFFNTELFNLKIFQSEEIEPKFAFVVSKKVSKSAVVRNKTKRIMAEIIRKNLSKISPNKNIILYAKKILNSSYKLQAEKAVLETFKQAKIIK